jgi:hypothetical protein
MVIIQELCSLHGANNDDDDAAYDAISKLKDNKKS